jgi:hypothetical protein
MTPRIAFHLGFHKTATTWFQREALPRHPAVGCFVPAAPMDSPFLVEILASPDRSFDPKRARELLEQRIAELAVPDDGVVVLSAERLSGNAATGGYDAVRIANRLAAVAPDAKVFWVVREQVSMLESEYRQLVREGSPAKLRNFIQPAPGTRMRVGFDPGQYEYDLLADAYARLFGPEQVRLFEFGALTADPAAFLDEVAAFLEIPPWPALSPEVLNARVNSSLPRRLMGTRRFMNHFERSGLNPFPVLAVRPVWRAPLSALAGRLPPPKKPFFDRATQDALRARYRASNQRLAERYGIAFAESPASATSSAQSGLDRSGPG